VDLGWWAQLAQIVQTVGLVAVGLVGVVIGWYRVRAANRQADAALRQAELARRDHVAELFNRAVGQLEDDKMHVRLGAIFTLRQITRDFPDLTAATICSPPTSAAGRPRQARSCRRM
jgi:hypothetical protein